MERALTTVGLNANTVQFTGTGTSNIFNISRSNNAPVLNVASSGAVVVSTPCTFNNAVAITSNLTLQSPYKVIADEVNTNRIIDRDTGTMSIEFRLEATRRVTRINSADTTIGGNLTIVGNTTFISTPQFTNLAILERLLLQNASAQFSQANNLTSSNMLNIIYNGNIDQPTNSNVNLVDVVVRPADSNIAAFSITQRGLVGIGTSQPHALLDMCTTSNNNAPYHLRVIDTTELSDCHSFSVSSNAYVGIGTSAPAYKLHVRCCDDDPFMVGTSNDVNMFRISNRGQLTIGQSNVDPSLAINVTPTMQNRIPHIEIHSLVGNTSNSNIIDGRQSQLYDMNMVTSSNSYLGNLYTQNIYADYIFTNSYENLGMDCISGDVHMFTVKVNRFHHAGRAALFAPSSNDFPVDPVTEGKFKIICEAPTTVGALSRGILVEGPVNTSIAVESSNNGAFYEMTARRLSTAAKARFGLQVDGTIVIGHDVWSTNPTSDFTDTTTPKIRIRPVNNSIVNGTPVVEMLSSTVITNTGIHINQSSYNTTRALQVAGTSSFTNDSAEPLLFLSGNNAARRVGICTDTPLFSFDVNGSANFRDVARFTTHVGIGTTNSSASDLLHIAASNAARNILVLNNIAGSGPSLRVLTARSNVIIDNSGYIGIGTTVPIAELDVRGNFNFTGTIFKDGIKYIESQWTTIPSTTDIYVLGNVGIGTTSPQAGLHIENKHVFCSSNITANGTMYSKGSFITTSDKSVKSELQQIHSALDRIDKLNGYTYWRNDLAKHEAGLIAQEVVEVLPEVVHKDISTGMMSVAYGNMAALFVEAIKDLRQRVSSLEARISSCSSL
jgi:hypothetical protein